MLSVSGSCNIAHLHCSKSFFCPAAWAPGMIALVMGYAGLPSFQPVLQPFMSNHALADKACWAFCSDTVDIKNHCQVGQVLHGGLARSPSRPDCVSCRL